MSNKNNGRGGNRFFSANDMHDADSFFRSSEDSRSEFSGRDRDSRESSKRRDMDRKNKRRNKQNSFDMW